MRSTLMTVMAGGLMLLAAAPASAQFGRGDVMVCRGGPTMRIISKYEGVPRRHVLSVQFTRAPRPADERRVEPGECAWKDQEFRQTEPSILQLQSDSVAFSFELMGSGRLARDFEGPLLDAVGDTGSADARDWQYITDAILNRRRFEVQAESGSAALRVTRVNR